MRNILSVLFIMLLPVSGSSIDVKTHAFTYDSLSRLTSAINTPPSQGGDGESENPTSNLSFAYDALGQMLESTTKTVIASEAWQSNISYTYDSAGRKISMTDPTGQTEYGHDKANRLTSITLALSGVEGDPQSNSFSIAYDAAGRRTGLTGPGGISRTYEYDNANRLLELINKVNGVEVAPFQYEYDKAGNRTKITDAYGQHLGDYDVVYRLLTLTNSVIASPQGEAIPSNETFSYDKTGNRTSDVTQSYEPNALNQIVSGSSGLSLSYDANGNVTSKTDGGVTWTYSWNSEGQLIQATSDESQATVSYQYDALGRRISRSSGSDMTQFIYDGEDILLEYTGGVLTGRYTHGPGIDEPLARTDVTTGANYFYHADALGSITAITDSSGSIVESYRYSSFGQPTIYDKGGLQIDESSIGNSYQYTGREYDSVTSLQFNRGRYYDPVLGRFISIDPIGFEGGINQYSYTGNSPLNWADPLGLDAEDVANNVDAATDRFLDSNATTSVAVNTIMEMGGQLMKGVSDILRFGEGIANAVYGEGDALDKAAGVARDVARAASLGVLTGARMNRPYCRYVGPKSNPTFDAQGNVLDGTWLTRDKYTSMAEAKSKLQLPHEPTSVEKVKVPWNKYVGGPRKVSGKSDWGEGGGTEYQVGH